MGRVLNRLAKFHERVELMSVAALREKAFATAENADVLQI